MNNQGPNRFFTAASSLPSARVDLLDSAWSDTFSHGFKVASSVSIRRSVFSSRSIISSIFSHCFAMISVCFATVSVCQLWFFIKRSTFIFKRFHATPTIAEAITKTTARVTGAVPRITQTSTPISYKIPRGGSIEGDAARRMSRPPILWIRFFGWFASGAGVSWLMRGLTSSAMVGAIRVLMITAIISQFSSVIYYPVTVLSYFDMFSRYQMLGGVLISILLVGLIVLAWSCWQKPIERWLAGLREVVNVSEPHRVLALERVLVPDEPISVEEHPLRRDRLYRFFGKNLVRPQIRDAAVLLIPTRFIFAIKQKHSSMSLHARILWFLRKHLQFLNCDVQHAGLDNFSWGHSDIIEQHVDEILPVSSRFPNWVSRFGYKSERWSRFRWRRNYPSPLAVNDRFCTKFSRFSLSPRDASKNKGDDCDKNAGSDVGVVPPVFFNTANVYRHDLDDCGPFIFWCVLLSGLLCFLAGTKFGGGHIAAGVYLLGGVLAVCGIVCLSGYADCLPWHWWRCLQEHRQGDNGHFYHQVISVPIYAAILCSCVVSNPITSSIK